MKSWQKTSLAFIVILILIVIGISLLVKSYLLPETIKLLVIPKVEEIINHTISYTELEVGIGGTIKLKNLTIPDPALHKQTVLLQSQDMVLHCRILPLLSKKIIIEEVTLRKPHINLIRDKQGNFNFLKDIPKTEKKAADKERADKASLDTTLSLTVTYLNIKDGKLIFTDHAKTSSPPFQLTVKNINLRASHISMISSFPLNLSAEIVATPPSFLKLKALINPLRKEVESKVELTPLDVTYFAPYFPNLPFTLLKGYCALNLKMTANRSLDLYSQGLISLRNITLSPVSTPDDELSDSFIDNLRNITIDLDHCLSYQPAEDTLVLEKLNTTIQKVKLSLQGKIEACKTHPIFDLTVDTGKLPVQNILNSFPQDLIPGGRDISSSGTTEANLTIKGSFEKLEDLKMNGSLTIDKLKIRHQQMPHCKTQIDGKISLSSNEITIKHLKTTFQDSPLILKGRINNYLKGPLMAELHLNSPSLVLDDIIYCLEEDEEKFEREEGEEEQEREEIGPFNFNDMKIKADIYLDSVSYKNMHISNLKATCFFQDNVFNLEPLAGTLADGSFLIRSRIDLGVRGLNYTLKLTGNRLQLNPLMTSFASDLQKDIDGIMDLTADFKGRGTASDTFKKNLKGKGEIHIQEGKVSGLKPLQTLSSFIKLDELDTLNFDQAHGTFQIKDGLIHTENSLKGKEIELYPQGTISLDANLDLILDMKLSPLLSERIANEALTKYFKDERGWTVIALAIKGPAGEVVVMPASSTIKNISEMIVDIILKKEEIDSDKKQDKKEALENLLKELMKKSKERKTK